MRLVTQEGGRSGILVGDQLVDGQAAAEMARLSNAGTLVSARAIAAAGREVWSQLVEAARRLVSAGEAVSIAAATLAAPITDPDKIICLGLNYRMHADESGLPVPTVPTFFAKFRNSLTGPQAPIVLPRVSDAVDYEGELAVVIGRPCRDVTPSAALDHVAGAMALNDVSARDLQQATSQWTAGKALDSFAPCGPALVTLDEVGDLGALRIVTRVNGQERQNGTTADMIFAVPETIAFLSALMTLMPGDIIAMGTPDGVGSSRTPPVFLRDGDLVEVQIDRIGTLRNRVVASGASG